MQAEVKFAAKLLVQIKNLQPACVKAKGSAEAEPFRRQRGFAITYR